jgi:hypothetical protein
MAGGQEGELQEGSVSKQARMTWRSCWGNSKLPWELGRRISRRTCGGWGTGMREFDDRKRSQVYGSFTGGAVRGLDGMQEVAIGYRLKRPRW